MIGNVGLTQNIIESKINDIHHIEKIMYSNFDYQKYTKISQYKNIYQPIIDESDNVFKYTYKIKHEDNDLHLVMKDLFLFTEECEQNINYVDDILSISISIKKDGVTEIINIGEYSGLGLHAINVISDYKKLRVLRFPITSSFGIITFLNSRYLNIEIKSRTKHNFCIMGSHNVLCDHMEIDKFNWSTHEYLEPTWQETEHDLKAGNNKIVDKCLSGHFRSLILVTDNDVKLEGYITAHNCSFLLDKFFLNIHNIGKGKIAYCFTNMYKKKELLGEYQPSGTISISKDGLDLNILSSHQTKIKIIYNQYSLISILKEDANNYNPIIKIFEMLNIGYTTEKDTLELYLNKNPQITFNKEVYKKYTNITTFYKKYELENENGYEYKYNNFFTDVSENSYICNISMHIDDNDKILQISDIISIEMLIEKDGNQTIYHKYSGHTLNAIFSATEYENNKYTIELPIVKCLFACKFLENGYNLVLKIKLNQFNVKLVAIVKYIEMLDQEEITKIKNLPIQRMIKHIVDETFEIKKGLNKIKLSVENMQCDSMFLIFPIDISKIDAELLIGGKIKQINKYYSNIQYSGLENLPNVMIFDVYRNISEFYGNQPTGNVMLDDNTILTFTSDVTGHLIVGYSLFDLIMYENKQIKFFDMPIKKTKENKKNLSTKVVVIDNTCLTSNNFSKKPKKIEIKKLII